MKVNRRAITILFGVLAVSFALGTILLFTPKGQQQTKGRPVLWVNGKPIYELDLARLQQSDPLFALAPEGTLRPLIETHFIEQVILDEALAQDASRVKVSAAEVKAEIDRLRQQLGLTDKEAYDRFLQQIGYTDALLRKYIRRALQIQKHLDEIKNKVELTEEEARFYFELHKAKYAPEDRVLARMIVVDDKDLAEEIKKQLDEGADFAELARKYSKIGAEQGGALGAEPGSSEPGPVVPRLVFPEPVAEAVLKLRQGGITPVIEAGGRYYIVQVVDFLPGGDVDYEEVKEKVWQDALEVKRQGVLEAYLKELRARTKVKFAEDFPYQYKNPVVARVNDAEIKLEDLNQVVLTNPQIPELIQNGLGEIVVQFFYPTTLDQLITQEVLYQEAKKTGLPFIGPKAQIATDVQLWKTKDVTVSEEEVRAYYEKNKDRFTLPPKADVLIARFKEEEKAKAFREAVLGGKEPKAAAEELGGEVLEKKDLVPDETPPVLQPVIFGDAPKEDSPFGKVSDVVKVGDEDFEVVIVQAFTPERVRPFEEVKEEARALALAEKRGRIAEEWVNELKAKAKIEKRLAEVLAELAPKTEEPEGEPAPEGEENGG